MTGAFFAAVIAIMPICGTLTLARADSNAGAKQSITAVGDTVVLDFGSDGRAFTKDVGGREADVRSPVYTFSTKDAADGYQAIIAGDPQTGGGSLSNDAPSEAIPTAATRATASITTCQTSPNMAKPPNAATIIFPTETRLLSASIPTAEMSRSKSLRCRRR